MCVFLKELSFFVKNRRIIDECNENLLRAKLKPAYFACLQTADKLAYND